MFLYLLLSLFYPSQACAIEDLDENNLIIPGGGYDGGPTNRVTKYNEILVSGESSWITISSYPISGGGVRVANYDNKLLSFGNITFILLSLFFQ